MDTNEQIPEELLNLIHQAIEGIIKGEGVVKLDAGLASNKEARVLFAKPLSLSASLTFMYQSDDFFNPI